MAKYLVTLHTERIPFDEEYLKGWCDEMSRRFGWDISWEEAKQGIDRKVIGKDEHGSTSVSIQVMQ